MAQPPIQNGPNLDDEDTFERDLKEMLKEGPTLNDLSNTVQGGSADTTPTYTKSLTRSESGNTRMPGSTQSATTIPRSHTVPPATSNIPLSSPERNGQGGAQRPKSSVSIPMSTKIDSLKAWSMNTYKCTRQILGERFGKASRTVDLELEAQIETLRDTQNKYSNILRLARALTSHFYHVVQTQRALGETFADLSQKSPELQEEFSYNSETQKTLCKHGETLLGALNFFTSSVNTLCNKTMEDTLMTIKLYENARVEYDAYRADMEGLQLGPRDSATGPRLDEAQRKFQSHKDKYDRLRGDVAIKLKFLEENKVTVTQRQLFLLHRAVCLYMSGGHTEVQAITKQFNVKPKLPAERGEGDA